MTMLNNRKEQLNMDNQEFFNFMNMDNAYKQFGITDSTDHMRWIKDIIGTKTSMFHYENLPDGLTSEIMERALMFTNHLCFYKSTEFGLILCKWRSCNVFNIYWKPITVTLLALNGQAIADNVPFEDIVLVRDNVLDIPPILTLLGWIDRIVDKEKTLDILIKLVRFPTILTGDKEQTTMLKTLIKKAINYDGFVIGSKGFKDHLEQFDIKLPARLEEIWNLLDQYKNMALASMGIYSVNLKRERVVTSEINAQNDYVDFIYTGMYNERKRFVEEVNKMYGTNIVLKEIYVENQEDDIELKADTAIAEAQGKILEQEVENEGLIDVAKVQAKAGDKHES